MCTSCTEQVHLRLFLPVTDVACRMIRQFFGSRGAINHGIVSLFYGGDAGLTNANRHRCLTINPPEQSAFWQRRHVGGVGGANMLQAGPPDA